MEIFFFWFICAVVVGIIANSRGRSGFGWFLLSAVFSPLLMGILVLALGRPKGQESGPAESPSEPPPQWLASREPAPASTTPAARSLADELRKLADLRDTGILTPDEFEAQKQRILNA